MRLNFEPYFIHFPTPPPTPLPGNYCTVPKDQSQRMVTSRGSEGKSVVPQVNELVVNAGPGYRNTGIPESMENTGSRFFFYIKKELW